MTWRLAGAMLIQLAGAAPVFGQSPGCAPVNDSLRTADSARLAPGIYSLVMVATDGPRSRSRINGDLTLRATSLDDRSSRTGQLPARGERRAAMPLWGWFNGDLRGVGAPLPDRADTTVPQPDSDDPIYPGVVVLVQNWQGPSRLRQNMLWISTGQNFRAERNWMMADGPGIVLNVRVLNAEGFAGTWGPAGLARVGGYYCARRMS
jgi:hypothetical protein